MTVRIVKRRGKRRLVLDIVYTQPDGSQGRFRRDAEVQLLAAARAEERRLALLVPMASPTGGGAKTRRKSAPPKPKTRPVFKEVAAEYLRTNRRSRALRASIDRYLAPRDSVVLTVSYASHAPVAQLDRAAAF
jgi:hypothetical protein